jgi:hypothetical protein
MIEDSSLVGEGREAAVRAADPPLLLGDYQMPAGGRLPLFWLMLRINWRTNRAFIGRDGIVDTSHWFS